MWVLQRLLASTPGLYYQAMASVSEGLQKNRASDPGVPPVVVAVEVEAGQRA